MNNRKIFIWRSLFYFLGLWFVALGIVFTIQAQLGVSPWEVLHVGLSKVTHLSVGVSSIVVGIVVVCFLLMLDRKQIKWGLLGNLFFIGLFMDLIIKWGLIPSTDLLIEQWIWLLIGLIVQVYGLSLYITANFGAGPRDSLMLALHKKYKLSIRLIRTIIEITVLGIGWLLGGPVSVGTLILALLTGPVLQYLLGVNRNLLNRLTLEKK